MHGLSVMRLAKLVRSNVDRQLSANRRNGETGAVAMLVAILFGTGVLLGLGALVIDTGSLLYERRQLQNGADAAVLSVAKTCAQADEKSTLCAAVDVSPSTPALVSLAGANAADTKSDVKSVCGSPKLVAANSAFTPCPTPASPGLIECPKTPSAAKYVEIRTTTRSGNGSSTILPSFLAQALVGGSKGETVGACARAGWGTLGSTGDTFPLALGVCGWNEATKGGTLFAPPPNPQYTPAPNQTGVGVGTSPLPSVIPVATLTAITAHTSSGSTGAYKCDAQTAGKFYPGGFGWTQTCEQLGTCAAGENPCSSDFLDTGNVLQGNNGASAPNGCKSGGIKPYVGTVMYIPIFKEVIGTTYVIDGLAAFYLAGYSNVPAGGPKDMDGYKKSLAPGCDPAGVDGANTTCLWGWFTAPVAPVGSISTTGSTPRGPLVVQVLG